MTNYRFTTTKSPLAQNGNNSTRGKWAAHCEQCRKLPLDKDEWGNFEFEDNDGEGALEAGRLATALSSYTRRRYPDSGWMFQTKRKGNILSVRRISV